jgi:PAS domain S-box-containing protein
LAPSSNARGRSSSPICGPTTGSPAPSYSPVTTSGAPSAFPSARLTTRGACSAPTRPPPREFTDRDAYFGRSVANVLASAIQNDRTQSELEEIDGRISDAFFALDEEWRFTYLNERAHEIINPEGKTLVGKKVWEEFPDAVGRKFEEQYEQAMREQETVSFEEYYPEPLDAWFEVRAYPSETGISVCFRNVTERKQVQQRLEEERDIFAQGPAIVFRWKNEPGWPVEYVSENVEDVLGYAPTELESGDVPYTDLHLDEEIDRIAREVEQNSDETTDRFSHEP